MTDLIRISEIFGPTIQGEGAPIGRPTVFVRTGGCDYRCAWCDTMHAVDSKYRDDWKPMSAADIMARVEELSGGKPLLITLSGGNPAIQPLGELIALGKKKGYSFAMETQGSVAQDWFSDLDILTLSPKPPSSGMSTDWQKFEECLTAATKNRTRTPHITTKIVIFDEQDYLYAKNNLAKFSQYKLYLQPGNHKTEGQTDTDALNDRLKWLIDRVNQDQWYDVTILPQLHVMLWGNKRGV